MNHTHSFWELDALQQPYDLVVVGAGITGLSSAYFYKKSHPGARVVVVEKGMYPEGASTRNAGFACFGSVTELMDDLEHETEEEVRTRLLRRYQGLQGLRIILGDENIGFRQNGGFEIFKEEQVFKRAEEYISLFNKWLFDAEGIRGVYRPTRINGYPAIVNRLEGALHPGRLIWTLKEIVRNEGIEFLWNSKVDHVEPGELVVNERYKLKAHSILLATNGFTSRLVPDIGIRPARGFVMVTSELSECNWVGTFHYDRGFVYFRNLGDRILLGGARNLDIETEHTYEFGVNPKIRTWLINFANEVLKLEKGWEVEWEWSGIMGFGPTKTPIVKCINDSIFVSAGFSGMGVSLGMEVGNQAAQLIGDTALDLI
ncbi:MAG TPA: FAD-dependent oxidoreductase [Balneolales bacterium]|nr:FAD-dependent oxidoreductase [Balneolales bacterium]